MDVVFTSRYDLLDDYCLPISRCLHRFGATYNGMVYAKVHCVREVEMFHTFVVGSGAEGSAEHDQESNDEIEDCTAPKTATPQKPQSHA